MVVAVIFSIIALGLGTTFISGMKIWDRARSGDFARYGLILDIETISTDFRQAIDFNTVPFEGKPQEASFPMVSGDSIFKVSYKFDPVAKALLKKQVKLKDAGESIKESAEKGIEKTFSGWEDFSIRYFYYDSEEEKYDWKDTWDKEEGVFKAVRLEVKFEGEQFVKTIFISAS